jgi:hypothetical protein
MAPSPDSREKARRTLAERARRISRIRRRVVAGAVASFVMAWSVIAWGGSLGASSSASTTTASTGTQSTQSSSQTSQSTQSQQPSAVTTGQS